MLFWAMLVEWLLLIPDLAAALVSGSVTMYATLLRSAVEAVAVTVAWLAARRIARGGGPGYDYGIGKLENLASLGVANIMAVSLLALLYEVYERIRHPVLLDPGHCGIAIAITLVAFAVDSVFLQRSARQARATRSPVDDAQRRIYTVKVASGAVALAALGLSAGLPGRAWTAYADPLGSLVMALLIIGSIAALLRGSLGDLLDRTLDEPLQLAIDRVLARHYDAYRRLHGVRSRRSGSRIHIELLLEFDGERQLADVQAAIDRIRADAEREVTGSVVLVAPVRAPLPADR